MNPLHDPRARLALAVAATVLVTDLVTKTIVERVIPLHATIPLLPVFALTHVRNTGAAFGFLAAAPTAIRLPLFLLVTVAAVIALVAFLRDTPAERRGLVAALGGILGGAAGNLVDRVRYGEVVDFLLVHWGHFQWPAFNVADSAITIGAAVILLQSFRRD